MHDCGDQAQILQSDPKHKSAHPFNSWLFERQSVQFFKPIIMRLLSYNIIVISSML